MKTLKMLPSNIEKIKQGIKTTTLRTYHLEDGLYRLDESTTIEIKCRGFLSYKETGEAIIKSEAFDTPQFQSTKDFLLGKRKLFVYDIVRQFDS